MVHSYFVVSMQRTDRQTDGLKNATLADRQSRRGILSVTTRPTLSVWIGGHNPPGHNPPGSEPPCQWQGRTKPPGQPL